MSWVGFRRSRPPAFDRLKVGSEVAFAEEEGAPVRCFDEAAIFPGEELLDAAVACFRMMLHLTAKFAHDVFDLSHFSVEGLPDRDQRVFALGRVGMGLVDDDLVVLGHRDAKLDLEATAPMSGLRPGDDDATTRNARTEFFETLHLRGDLGSDLFGRLAMPKGDVDWSLHYRSFPGRPLYGLPR